MKARITPIGAVVMLLIAAGSVLAFLGSGTAAKVGIVVAVLAVAFAIADQLPAGVMGGFLVRRRPARGRGIGADPQPKYIERAAAPSEDAWRREQQRYQQKNSSDDGA